MPNKSKKIPDNFGHLVKDSEGNWIEATPTATPAPTRTISEFDKKWFGELGAGYVRRPDGSINFLRLLELMSTPHGRLPANLQQPTKTPKRR